jgi:hypothetical protein
MGQPPGLSQAMANYLQWLTGARKARVLWVCGPEQALVRDVVASVRACNSQPVVLWAPAEEDQAWEQCAQYALPGTRRLVIVYEAQHLADLGRLASSCAALADMPGVTFVFVSSEPDYFIRVKGSKREIAPAPAVVQACSYGQIVRCAITSEADKLAWLAPRLPKAPATVARVLLSACGGDLSAAAAVCAKLAAANQVADPAAVLALAERPPGAFADSLVLGDRGQALASLPGAEGLGWAIGQLAARLDTMASLHQLVK